MATAIEFEHVGKQYRLGLVSTRTLSHDLNRWWQTSVLNKEDPYLQIGEVNDRSKAGNSEYVWALRDIDFKVEQGDVVGIIGKNGAGKSTLLKLLSKVTGPTVGTIRARGRIGALLEVGTGFHPEMTGRENIYMNGAIMGMNKAEITRKLDEIIDFSGCERYIDTPVKRYSSGMKVRLGFAVAAHLEPEILVVDEVLAVGDAEFQKKAIGKMQDVSKGEGRTVLFVSHNMASIRTLCHKGVLLDSGRVSYIGDVQDTVNRYLNETAPMEEGAEMKMKILYVVIFLMAFVGGALVYRDRVRYEYEKGIDDYLAYAESNFTEDDAIVYADLHNDYLTVYYNENYSYIFGFKDEFNPFDNDETLTQKEQLDKVKGNVYLICFDNKNPDWFLKCEYEKTYGFHFLYYDFSIYRIYNVQ